MRLGIISDTHGHLRNTQAGVKRLEERGVDQILHCGDIGSPAIPGLITRPAHFVWGNVDQDVEELREAIAEAGHTCHERCGEWELEGIRLALVHGDDPKVWQRVTQEGARDVVCFGHTHRREARWVGTTLLMNPGAVYRATPHTVAILELPQRTVEFLEF
jgi:uncharacterized protein